VFVSSDRCHAPTLTFHSSPASLSAYQDDPLVFTDGGKYVWRNGDTNDPVSGLKCVLEVGGDPAGNAGTANVQSLAFVYVW